MSVKQDLKDYRTAIQERGTLDQHLEDVTRIMAPRLEGFTSQPIEGDRRGEEIFDNTALIAARSLGNSIGSLLFPEGENWFFIGTEDEIESEDTEAKIWMQEAERRTRKAMDNPKARFKQTVGETNFGIVTVGTGPFFIGMSTDETRLSYQSILLKDAFIAQNAEGMSNQLYRRWKAKAWQINQFFKDKPGPAVKEAMIGGSEHVVFEYVHVVRPRKSGKFGALLSKNRPFTGDWIEVTSETRVEEGGFNEFPYIVPRWDTTTGEPYGRSPGMIALPDASTSQAMAATILEAGQRSANPPLLFPNDGTFDVPNTMPGGLVGYDVDLAREMGRIPIEPLNTGTNLPITRDMQRDTRDQIMNAFFRNVFNLPLGGPQMTATEVIARKEEFIREVGSVFGRLEADYVAPTVERTFQLLLEVGAFPPIPESLQGANVKFTYRNPISQVREEIEAASIQLTIQEVVEIAQTDPTVMDNYNLDFAARSKVSARSLPEGLLVPVEVVAERRQQRAEAEAEAAAAAAEAEQNAQTVDLVSQAAGAANQVAGAANQAGFVEQ